MLARGYLLGKLSHDPELKFVQVGGESKPLVNFQVMTWDVVKKDNPEFDYFDATAWGSTAEFIANYLTKGRGVFVEGKLKQQRWTANDGTKRSKIILVVELVRPTEKASVSEPAEVSNPVTPEEHDYEDPFKDD